MDGTKPNGWNCDRRMSSDGQTNVVGRMNEHNATARGVATMASGAITRNNANCPKVMAGDNVRNIATMASYDAHALQRWWAAMRPLGKANGVVASATSTPPPTTRKKLRSFVSLLPNKCILSFTNGSSSKLMFSSPLERRLSFGINNTKFSSLRSFSSINNNNATHSKPPSPLTTTTNRGLRMLNRRKSFESSWNSSRSWCFQQWQMSKEETTMLNSMCGVRSYIAAMMGVSSIWWLPSWSSSISATTSSQTSMESRVSSGWRCLTLASMSSRVVRRNPSSSL